VATTIDTLRLADHLAEKGKFSAEQARAIAQGFAQEAREDFASKRGLDVLYWKLIAGLAVMLLAHLAAVWAIVAAVAARGGAG